MPALVTGATGFIGRHLVARLNAEGRAVRAFVRPRRAPSSSDAEPLIAGPNVEVIEGSLDDFDAVVAALDGVDSVFHLAWQSNRPSRRGGARSDADEIVRANVEGARNLLAACTAAHVERIVFTSTVAVYGRSSSPRDWPVGEDDVAPEQLPATGDMRRNYVEPKLRIERMIRRHCRENGLTYVILRPSIVYGPDAPFAEPLVRAALRSQGGRRSWEALQPVHVDDVVEALLLADAEQAAENRTYTIAGDEMVTKQQLDTLIRRAARGAGDDRRIRLEELDLHRYDLSRAETELGFHPQVTVDDGISGMVAHVLGGARRRRLPTSELATTELLEQYYERALDADVLGPFYEHSDYWNFGYRERGHETQLEACEQLMERLLAFVPRKSGQVLDVACGKGATTRHLARYWSPEAITGINISEAQLEVCRRNVPGARFLRMDAAHLDFPDKSFDTVICVEAATHFDTRERFFREALRVLTPGGRLVLSDAILTPWSRGQPPANYVTEPEAYRQQCLSAGFADAHVEDVTRECWYRFRTALLKWLRESLRDGEVTARQAWAVRRWLRQAHTELYVLAWCEAPA